MDGFICMLNKNCRKEKSEEIVQNINDEEKAYEEIYKNNKKRKSK